MSRRSTRYRAAALERAARILDAAGPGTPEAKHAAALRLEALTLGAPAKIDVADHATWTQVGRALARLDHSAFCRLMIAAQAIVGMHAATDPDAVFYDAVAILDASNRRGLPS